MRTLPVLALGLVLGLSAFAAAQNTAPTTPAPATPSAPSAGPAAAPSAAATLPPRTDGSVHAISPIFSQIVMMAQPAEFKVVFEESTDARYIREAVPAGEAVENWTEIITVTGAKGLAENPNIKPIGIAQNMAGGFQSACPESFVAKPLGGTKYSGFDVFLALASCGSVKTGATPHSETTLIIAIKGASDIYTIQWAERGPPSQAALAIDDAKWLARYKRLGPIRLCPIVPGEAAPYPSCVNRR